MVSIKYQKIYNQFIENYKQIHLAPWHEINEDELKKIYINLVNTMNITDMYTFKYFMDYIIKRLNGKSDAHTKLDMVSTFPINFKIFDDEIIVNYPEVLKGASLKTIDDISILQIVGEIEDVISYGTDGKRRFEIEKALFNRYTMFSLPSFRGKQELSYTFITPNGDTIIKTFKKNEKDQDGQLFDYDEYLYGNNATYKIIDNILIYNHSSVQSQFEGKIKAAIEKLIKEDLTHINTIIIDIRGNTGGNSGLNSLLINFLKKHPDKKLLCLTDYRVFSAGRYALGDLIELGATTIGSEISTPINCFGNNNWINIDGYNFVISEKYFNPFLKYSANNKEQFSKDKSTELLAPYIFKPDIYIEETKQDFIEGKDTVLNFALKHFKTQKSL